MADDRIEIEIVLDDGSIQRGFAKVRSESGKTAKVVESRFDKARKAINNIGKGMLGRFTAITAAITAAGAALTAGLLGRRAIGAASAQEDAIRRLNTQLSLAGTFSKEASQQIQDFANEMQRTTRASDDAVIASVALARTFARTNEEAVKMTRAAIELSEATGGKISVESAITNLGKSFSGLTGELGEALPIVKELTQEQLKAGEATDLILKRFGGAAASNVKTFSGATEQLKNNFDNFLKAIGKVITKSPSLIAVINKVSEKFDDLAKSINKSAKGEGDIFFPLLNGLLKFLAVVVRTAISTAKWLREFRAGVNTVILGWKFLKVTILEVFADAVKLLDDLIAKTKEFLGLGEDNRNDTIIKGGGFASALGTEDPFVEQGVGSAAEQSIRAASDKAREELKLFREEFNASINETFGEETLQDVLNFIEKLQEVGLEASKTGEATANGFKRAKDEIDKATKKVTVDLLPSFKKAIVALGSVIGETLAGSDTAFQKFGKIILNIFGDILIQLGTGLVLIGLGIEALKAALTSFAGGAAIAAGFALIALGAVLKTAAAAGDAATAGGGGGAAGADPTPDLEIDEDEEDGPARAARGTEVIVNIQGDVLDSEETGLRIAEIINNATDNQGAQFA